MITWQEYYPMRTIKGLSGLEWERYATDLYRDACELEAVWNNARKTCAEALGLRDRDDCF